MMTKRSVRMTMRHMRGTCVVEIARLALGSKWLRCTIVEGRVLGSEPVYAHPEGDDGESLTVTFQITQATFLALRRAGVLRAIEERSRGLNR